MRPILCLSPAFALALSVVLSVPTTAFAVVRVGLLYKQSQAQQLPGSDPLLNYRHAIEVNGGQIVTLSPSIDSAEMARRLESLDALLVPGGEDVNPAFYGEDADPSLESVDTDFDRFEFLMIGEAAARRLPMLGICRGHQIMNVFRGGSLYQDIPTLFPARMPVVHRIRVEGVTKPCHHEISIKEGTLMHRLFGRTRLLVNSYHHQALKALGSGLLSSAQADDGVIEAVENDPAESCPTPHQTWHPMWPDAGSLPFGESPSAGETPSDCQKRPFALGLQFHPEKELKQDPGFNAVFEAFLRAAADRR